MKNQKEKKAVKSVQEFLSVLLDPNRFEKRPDGWVKDKLLGVEWGPSSGERMTFTTAKKFCSDQGGRLPTIEEIHSLVDYDAHDPAVMDMFSKDTKRNWYWSCTKHLEYTDSVWCVGFKYGDACSNHKDFFCYVRPVCRSASQ